MPLEHPKLEFSAINTCKRLIYLSNALTLVMSSVVMPKKTQNH